jgi:predicted Zn-dependent peptidase
LIQFHFKSLPVGKKNIRKEWVPKNKGREEIKLPPPEFLMGSIFFAYKVGGKVNIKEYLSFLMIRAHMYFTLTNFVRSNGYLYSIEIDYVDLFSEGFFCISSNEVNDVIRKKVVKKIDCEFNSISSNEIDPLEFPKLKNYIRNHNFSVTHDNKNLADRYEYLFFLREIDCNFEEVINCFDTITSLDIKNASKKYFTSRNKVQLNYSALSQFVLKMKRLIRLIPRIIMGLPLLFKDLKDVFSSNPESN